MGWLFTNGTTREAMVQRATRPFGGVREEGGVKIQWERRVIARSYSGNNLWTVCGEFRGPEGGELTEDESLRFIALFLIRGGHGEWGYKDVEESMGPLELTCPPKFLDMTPDPGWRWDGRPWRERVREHWAAKKIKQGAIYETQNPIRFRGGGEYKTFLCQNAKRSHFIPYFEDNGLLRQSWERVKVGPSVRAQYGFKEKPDAG